MSSPFLEKRKPVAVTLCDNLPHWHQQGKIQFVTFRLADSLPQILISEIKSNVETFNRAHPKPWDESTVTEYKQNIIGRYEKYLDSGYGSCLLRNQNARQFLVEAMKFHNGKSCKIIAYVVMPNHVHILMQLLSDFTLDKIIQSIKRYSSVRIRQLLNISDKIWMRRYFDRLVRDEEDLVRYIEYVCENPRYLREGDFELYVHPDYQELR